MSIAILVRVQVGKGCTFKQVKQVCQSQSWCVCKLTMAALSKNGNNLQVQLMQGNNCVQLFCGQRSFFIANLVRLQVGTFAFAAIKIMAIIATAYVIIPNNN